MLWLWIALAAYLLNAIAATVDKILLSNDIPNPRVYTFFISLLGGLGIVLAPWGVTLISWELFCVALLTGVVSVSALWAFFNALIRNEASRVVPIVGGLQPIIIFFLAARFIGEQLTSLEILAVLLFILGGIIITLEPVQGKVKSKAWIIYAVVSGSLFGALHFLSKYLFEHLDFINGFVWPRITTAGVALLFLLSPNFIKALKDNGKNAKPSSKFLFLLGQSAGAAFFILINYAISLGSVTIVNALQGVQYVFVFVFMILLSMFIPKLVKEDVTKKVLVQKSLAIVLIILGIILLVL